MFETEWNNFHLPVLVLISVGVCIGRDPNLIVQVMNYEFELNVWCQLKVPLLQHSQAKMSIWLHWSLHHMCDAEREQHTWPYPVDGTLSIYSKFGVVVFSLMLSMHLMTWSQIEWCGTEPNITHQYVGTPCGPHD